MIYRLLYCFSSMFLILKSKWYFYYIVRMSIVCKFSVIRLCMCWFFYFLIIFKFIRCLKIFLCMNMCSLNEIFNLFYLVVFVLLNVKVYVGNF